MKTASQKVIAENKILRKLAEVPENYDFDYDEVIIADQDRLDDYKKQVTFLESEVKELEKDR